MYSVARWRSGSHILEMTTEDPLTVRDENLDRIRESGNRLMSFSNLAYEGRFVSAAEFERVHVMEFGDRAPVILMHGAGMGGPVWHRQISALAHDHRVIVPDIPMFGLSDMPRRVCAPREQISDVKSRGDGSIRDREGRHRWPFTRSDR